MNASAHEGDDVAYHLTVMLHVRPVGVQGAVSIEGDEAQVTS